ncbi:MAG: ATP synthase subunit I [Deltaproteobacteria bacterium]|nr:ATP synthase subunit I [Deltaproteobacteria bacterium]
MRAITSFLLGGVIAGVNLYLLTRIIRRIDQEKEKGRLGLLVAAKFLFLFGIISLILWKGHVTPLAFLGGFSLPLVGYLCMSLRGSA